MPRAKGPDKKQILIRLLLPTVEKLQVKADEKGETLPGYLSRNIERLADRL